MYLNRGGNVRLKFIAFACLLSSTFASAQTAVSYVSCVDVTMVKELTDLEKQTIQNSATPDQEKCWRQILRTSYCQTSYFYVSFCMAVVVVTSLQAINAGRIAENGM